MWNEHFKNLLGKSRTVIDKPIKKIINYQLGQLTQGEIDVVLREIKNRKAAGINERPPEVGKTRKFHDLLLR